MMMMLKHLLDPVHPGHQGGGVVCQAHGEGTMGALRIIMIMLNIMINDDNDEDIDETVDDDNKYIYVYCCTFFGRSNTWSCDMMIPFTMEGCTEERGRRLCM